jgi:hypothetical protein
LKLYNEKWVQVSVKKIGSSKKYSNLQQRYEETIYAYYKAGTGKTTQILVDNGQTDKKIALKNINWRKRPSYEYTQYFSP